MSETEPPEHDVDQREQGSKRHSNLKFRFKSKRRRLDNDDREELLRGISSEKDGDYPQDEAMENKSNDSRDHSKKERRSSHRKHRSRRHRRERDAHDEVDEDPRASQKNRDKVDFDPFVATASLDPDAAFRETLFDALADDEAADYWQDVYGQPIHIYPRPDGTQGPTDPENSEPGVNVHSLNDDEYAAYVRAKMWEKTQEAADEEKKARARERQEQRKKEQARKKMGEEKAAFEAMIDDSLKRGQRRREEKGWEEAWKRYARGWEALMAATGKREGDGSMIPWPVKSGEMGDVSQEEVEMFFRKAVHSAGAGKERSDGLRTLLKTERVRWHPDKMMHRFGGSGRKGEEGKGAGLDTQTLQAITAVFQLVDAMWAQTLKSE